MEKFLPALGVCWLLVLPAAAQPVVTTAAFDPLIAELQTFVETSNLQRFMALLSPEADVAEAREIMRRGCHWAMRRTGPGT